MITRYYGIDFSGAKDAGRKIWIAAGVRAGPCLRIVDAFRGQDLPGAGRRPEECLPALVRFVEERRDAAFGCDFPFSLPIVLVRAPTWDAFALGFGRDHPTADAFRAFCLERAGGRELRRLTDREARTPFAAYNARIHRQTYHGIRDLLAPLVWDGAASILPMQPRRPATALILEICPACTLKRDGLYRPYKGASPALAAMRERILSHFEERGQASLESSLRRQILADPGGDALDSVIAALGTCRAVDEGLDLSDERADPARIEGWVYF
jgi:hypothetical protein